MRRRRRVALVGVIALVGILSLSVGMTGGLLSDSVSLDGNEIEGGEDDSESADEPSGQSYVNESADTETDADTEETADDTDEAEQEEESDSDESEVSDEANDTDEA